MKQTIARVRPRLSISRCLLAGILLLCLVSVSGCATNRQTGAVVGLVAGAALGVGTAVLTGSAEPGMVVGGLIGAGLGALIGGAIGADLDESEKLKAAAAAQKAAEVPIGSQVKWESDTHSDVKGYAEPAGPEEYEAGGVCKTIHQVVFTSDGEKSQNSRLCRKNGQWQPA